MLEYSVCDGKLEKRRKVEIFIKRLNIWSGKERRKSSQLDYEVRNRKGAESGLEISRRTLSAQRHVNYLDR